MSWIKRNLYFLICGVVAVALLGASGWYLFKKIQLNKDSDQNLESAYNELQTLADKKPNPGGGPNQPDNISNATFHTATVLATVRKMTNYFAPIAPVPNLAGADLTDQAFAGALRNTLNELQREAVGNGVALPSDYNFSFFAERQLVRFAPGGVPALASQLGEVKTICNILFAARINSFEGIQRERVSDDDSKGSATDYLDDHSVTNDLAVATPYKINFHCFSQELADVLNGFNSLSNAIVVKTIDVTSSTAATPDLMGGMAGQTFPNPAMPAPAAATPAATTLKGGLTVVLDEKPIQVTISLEIIKLQPKR